MRMHPSEPASGTTTPPTEPGTMHINRIEMSWWYRTLTRTNKFVFAEAIVFIVDAEGVPVPGATVSGHWEDATTDSDSGVTDDNGIVFLRSDTIRNPPDGTTFTFEVDGVVLSGWDYIPSENVETWDSITYP